MSDSSVFRSVRRPERRGAGVAARILKWGALVVVLAVVAGVVLLIRRADAALDPVTLQTLVLNETDPDALVDEVEGTSVTLLVGVDRRAVPPPAIADATADPRGPAAAQMVALVQTHPDRETTAVTTFPLDLMVLPAGQPEHVRLDRVQALGGPDALLSTVQTITGIRIDHYVELDLAGVVGVVDAVGGVEVCLDEVMEAPPQPTGTPTAGDEAATPSPTPTPTPVPTPTVTATADGSEPADDGQEGVPAGCQQLDGAAAAGYLASRSDPSQPIDVQERRIAEQHYLLAQVLDRTQLSAVLFNPLRITRVLAGLDAAVATDVDPGLRGMAAAADSIAGFDRNLLEVRVVPSYRRSEDGDTLLYVDQATALFDALRAGDELAGVGEVTGDEVGPEDVTVLVVNGVGTPGLAGSAQTYLQSRGFEVACAANPSDLDPRATYDDSQVDIVVQYLADRQVQSELLVEALGDLPVTTQPVEQLPPMPTLPECVFDESGSVDVVLTVGTGWPQ